MKFIINPASKGGRTAKLIDEIKTKSRERGIDAEIVLTRYPMHAAEIAENSKGEDIVVAVGGDGTINEVVNGIMKLSENERPALGIIPVATGGDFIKTIGIPNSIDKALDIIKSGKKKKIDAAICFFKNWNDEKTSRYYINITEFGLGGYVADTVNKYGKNLPGKLSFFLSAVICNFTYKNKLVRIKTDNEDFKDFSSKIRVVAVANGRFYGGGMEIAPLANPEDGLFDVVVINTNSIETLKALPLVYKGIKGFEKAEEKYKEKFFYFRAKKIEVLSEEKIPIEMEGEVPGHSPEKFEIIPKALYVITK